MWSGTPAFAANETNVCRKEWNVASGVRRCRPSRRTEVWMFAALKMRESSWFACHRDRPYSSAIIGRTGPEVFGTQMPSAYAELGETCAATTQLRFAQLVSLPLDADQAFCDCGAGATDDENSTRAVATSENASSCVSRKRSIMLVYSARAAKGTE